MVYYLLSLIFSTVVIVQGSPTTRTADVARFITGPLKNGRSQVRIVMEIHSITEVNFKKSTFKASISLTIIQEGSSRTVGATQYPFIGESLDDNAYPFNHLYLSSLQAHPKGSFRIVKTTSDKRSTSSTHYDLEVFCPYQFKEYPFDVQSCEINIFAVRYTRNDLTLSWDNLNPVQLDNNASPPNVKVALSATEQCDYGTAYEPSVRYGCLRAKLQFSRPLSISVVRFFLPSMFCVFITWVATYINRERIQTRVTLIVVPSLMLFLLKMNSSDEIPVTTYLTAADYWIIICSLFMFFAFAEIIVAHVLTNMATKRLKLMTRDGTVRSESQYRHEKRAARTAGSSSPRLPTNGRVFEKKHESVVGSRSTSNYDVIVSDYFRHWSDYYSVSAARVDITARIILPITFFVSAILYFVLYIFL